MIEFKPIIPKEKELYARYLFDGRERGCELSFANLCLWGKQQAAILYDHMVLYSQFNQDFVYPYPVGTGNKKAVLDSVIADARERGIPCRITSLREDDILMLEQLYPGKFRIACSRNSSDYVYSIDDLADLKGRKYHRKRNHLKRFRDSYPEYTVRPLDDELLPQVRHMVDVWYSDHQNSTTDGDFEMEQTTLCKALQLYRELDMETLVLLHDEEVLAITFGSRLSEDTFDIHFEKAKPDADGAYTAINYEFANYLRRKYPEIRFLNREEDMGVEGLRKAKESYYPHHMVEKCHAVLLEEH